MHFEFQSWICAQQTEWARVEVMEKDVTQICDPTGFSLLGHGAQLALSQALTLALTAALSFTVLCGEGFPESASLRKG